MANLDLEAFEELMQKEQQMKLQQQVSDNIHKAQGQNPENGEKKQREDDQDSSRVERRKNDKRQDERHHKSGRQGSQESVSDDNDRKKVSKKHKRSRSRSSRSSHSDDSSYRRNRKKKGKLPGKHPHSRRRHRSYSSESRDKSDEEAVNKRKKDDALEKNLVEAKKQAEEAHRDDCTVLVSRIHLQVDEKEVYLFFTTAGVGKIRDVRLIRDSRSGKSKGIAYVEFYTPESVLIALAMSNQQLRGQTIMVQASQAEKNRTAAATKYKKQVNGDSYNQAAGRNDKNDMPQVGNTLAPRYQHQQREINNRVYIGGLVGSLGTLSQHDIREWFSPFGGIDAIELPKDPYTGQNKGHSIVEFQHCSEAKMAAQTMNDFEVMPGQKLKVSILQDGPRDNQGKEGTHKEEDLGEDTTNTYLHSAKDRALLMQKLMGQKDNDLMVDANVGQAKPVESNVKVDPISQLIQNSPSNCLLFQNLFDATTVDLKKDPSFFIDIKDQVMQVCQEFGKIDKIFVEQRSNGHVWVRFTQEEVKNATTTLEALNMQFFDQRQIKVAYISESAFINKYKER